MSASASGSGQYLVRTTNVIAANVDYSCCAWVRINSAAVNTEYRFIFGRIRTDYGEYAVVQTEDDGTNRLRLRVYDGTTEVLSNFYTWTPGTWFHVAYVKTGTAHRLLINGVLVNQIILNVSADTYNRVYALGDSFDVPDTSMESFREFNDNLSDAEVLAEAKSSVPRNSAECTTNTPLTADYDDTTASNNDWTNTGTSLDADTPYPAANVDPESAIDVGTLAVAYQQIVNANPSGAFAFDLWWKITGPAGLVAFSIFGRSNNFAGNSVDVDFWETAGATTGASVSSENNYPIIGYLDEGDLHYISATPSSRTATPYVVTMDMEAGPTDTVVAGDIFSNDDQDGLPAVILSSTVDYEVKRYLRIPAGESGDIILNGNMLIGARYIPAMVLYDSNFVELASFTGAHGGNHSRGIRANRATSKFYFVRNGNLAADAIIDRVSGTAIETTFTMTGTTGLSLGSISPRLDDLVLYHCSASSNQPIVAWDIPGNASLGNVVAAIASEQVIDILSLADGTYAVLRWMPSGANSAKIYHYNNAWVLQNTWTVGTATTSVPPRMSWGLDDPNSVWVKLIYADGVSDEIITEFINVKISDGSVLGNVIHATFFDGAYTPDLFDGSAPVALFGAPSSCPFFLIPSGAAPTGTLTVGKMTDPYSPDVDFIIDVSGGLSPAQLTLQTDEEHVYDPVPVGEYAVVEQSMALFFPTYLVSNDVNNDNLHVQVGPGENVTVAILNTRSSRGSGIFELVPGGSAPPNDAFRNQNGEVIRVAIPNPYVIIGGLKDI